MNLRSTASGSSLVIKPQKKKNHHLEWAELVLILSVDFVTEPYRILIGLNGKEMKCQC